MKKKLLILGIIALVLITGCGQKEKDTTKKMDKMVCTRTSNMNDLEMDFNYQVYYEGNNVNKVQTTEKIISDDTTVLGEYKQQIEALYSNFDNIENYNYNVVIEGDTLTSTTDINYEKIDINELLKIDSSISQLLNDDNKIDLDKITEVYEQIGATCEKE